MVPGVSSVVVLVICASMSISVFALDFDCIPYKDSYNIYHSYKECKRGFCCGSCTSRDCCSDFSRRLSESAQEACAAAGINAASWGNLDTDEKFHKDFRDSSHVVMITSIVGSVLFLLLLACCCICPCCCIYKMCRRPQPVVATTTHTTVVTSAPQQYPQQPVSVPGQPLPYQAAQYPPYQPMPVQPGYGTQPMPASPYKGQAFTPGPPPPYQEAIGPAYPPNQPMPYSQAAYNPGQPAYPLHPPTYPQPNAPSSHADFLAQPAYNPDYVAPPTTGSHSYGAINPSMVIAISISAVIFTLICVCLITCFVAPCCCCYKLCRKQRNQRQIVVTNTAANMPQPHYSPPAYQAQPPGYQAMTRYEGSTLPSTPPPSYRDSISPSYPAPFVPWQAMYPLSPPSQPSAPPLPSDEIGQPPHNPIYRPQR